MEGGKFNSQKWDSTGPDPLGTVLLHSKNPLRAQCMSPVRLDEEGQPVTNTVVPRVHGKWSTLKNMHACKSTASQNHFPFPRTETFVSTCLSCKLCGQSVTSGPDTYDKQ